MTDKIQFSDLGLSATLLDVVASVGYTTPTPIQAQIIPHIIKGHDVLGCAQTGTGKTASFTLPMIDILSSGRARARMPRSLVLIPTRELAAQVQENFDNYSKKSALKHALLIGGAGFSEQEKKLDRGVDVIIATPGRMLDMHERGKIMLHDLKVLVLDEADRMLDMGFMPDIEKVVKLIPKNRQTLLFSATMPKEIKKLANTLLTNPIEVTVSPPTTTATTITQSALNVKDSAEKRKVLREIINFPKTNQVIVFCNTKKEATNLGAALKRGKHSVGVLHGDMNQNKRTETLDEFKAGKIKVLIASDVAARGLDIDTITHVVNYDVPGTREDYIHRIGRTGRAGQQGNAITFINKGDKENWSKVIAGSKDKITEHGSLDAFKPVKKTAKPEKQTTKPEKQTEKKPTKEKPAKKPAKEQPSVVGFGDSIPSFMNVVVDLPKKKSPAAETFHGVKDTPEESKPEKKATKKS